MTATTPGRADIDLQIEQLAAEDPQLLAAFAEAALRALPAEVARAAFERTQRPEWDACEDCMASGGHRDRYGEGTCGACGGRGRRPANDLAWEIVRAEEERRRAAAEAAARRAFRDRDEYGAYQ